jgi:hypothetical protein
MCRVAAMRTIRVEERRARLARRHRLVASRRTNDVEEIARSVVALHSSDPASVFLSTAARAKEPSIDAVTDALYADRSVVRYHAMRRTLWVSDVETARLAHASSATTLVANETKRLIGLLEDNGVTKNGRRWLSQARTEVLRALDDAGEASSKQLGEAVPKLRQPLKLAPGKSYESTQHAHVRVLLLLGFEGTIIRTHPMGTWINSQYRWAPTEAWVPGGIAGHDPKASAAALADRWLRAFGPATTSDVQWWTGWTQRATTDALSTARAVPVCIEDVGDGWVAADDVGAVRAAPSWVALLPGLDPTTMGWKQRDWYLDPAHGSRLFDRNGNAGPTIWADGRIVGGWVQRKDGTIATELLTDVGTAARDHVDRSARDLEHLIGDTRFTVRFPSPSSTALRN